MSEIDAPPFIPDVAVGIVISKENACKARNKSVRLASCESNFTNTNETHS